MLSNKSLILVLLPAMISGAVAMFINWRIHKDMEGVAWWPVGSAVSILGALVRTMEGLLPDWVVIVGANAVILGGQIMVLYGLCRFAAHPMFTRASWGLMAVLIVGMVWLTWITPLPLARTAFFTAIIVATFLLQTT